MSSDTPGPVWVILAAAGGGTRLGGPPKQFRQLAGIPVLVQTARVFERHPLTSGIVVACPAGGEEQTRKILLEHNVSAILGVVEGGATRQASIGKALSLLSGKKGIVLTHDAVRPFVRRSEIDAVIDAARRFGAAAPAIPVADTIYSADGNVLKQQVDRSALVRIQTPQGFRLEILEQAHRDAVEHGWTLTDETGLVAACGFEVRTVVGSERNIKITTPGDWAFAQKYWKHWVESEDN